MTYRYKEDKPENWIDREHELPEDNTLWKQYEIYIDIFKFYLDTTWKVVTWFYAITGAILVYYFDHADNNNPYLRYSLVLPALLSIGFFIIFGKGAQKNKKLNEWLDYIRSELGIPGRPHTEILLIFLEQSRNLFAAVFLGLTILFVSSFFW
ncbi:hypothetical protein [Acaryochloris marina]|uniref:Uncharacterized protein n=1 Tax=Acaryochloris marina (strain MBIC 11017) TaxID=329726 RepID=A8ZNF3_ACAM1|nr:hypothetical protein [Acaryochloris marina]ABW32539.1 hypothetical protein AM1_D0042 [Acaryochloris marina MBIC11017]